MSSQLAFCSIISKNYIARARTLADSIRTFHPEATFDVLLVDRLDGYLDPSKENFSMTFLEDLPIPNLPKFCFQYNILELNTAAKPYYLQYLLEKRWPTQNKLVYLDPDILVLDSLSPLSRYLETYNALLTPHTTVPYPDNEEQREVDLLRAGVFNLGFIALRRSRETSRFLSWWQKRLYTGCRSDLSKGFHVDQKWIDLAPAFFDGFHILKDPGYNIATWNLHSHPILCQQGKFYVGSEPLRFFHFSAFDPLNLNTVSRYQHRYHMDNIGDLKSLFILYSQILRQHGYELSVKWPYAFGRFQNGENIPPKLRELYLRMGEKSSHFGNPFESSSHQSLYHWWKTQGEAMPKEQLTELLNRDPRDWNFNEIAGTFENQDLYTWFRRENPKPAWNGSPFRYLKLWLKFLMTQVFMQWLPPLFAKQFVLNRLLIDEIRRLRKGTPT